MATTFTESRDELISRLAQKARDEGVKLYKDPKDQRHYASSVSNPGHLHYLTAVSCTCAGFAAYSCCKHWAALLVALGWAGEDDPEPEPSIAALPVPRIPCETCNGLGEIQYTRGTGPRTFVHDWMTCPTCHGRGGVACPSCMDTGLVEAEGDFCGQTQTPCTCEAGQALTVRDLTIVDRETGKPAYRDAA